MCAIQDISVALAEFYCSKRSSASKPQLLQTAACLCENNYQEVTTATQDMPKTTTNE